MQDNGGPTIGAPGNTLTLQTEALLKGSPAIGKGILPGAPKTDERGFPSVTAGRINIGAVSQRRRTVPAAGTGHAAEAPRDLLQQFLALLRQLINVAG